MSNSRIQSVAREKPVQTGKLLSIVLALVFGITGFLRIIDISFMFGRGMIGDSQFLVLLLIPLVSIALVFVVFLETIVTLYRVVRSPSPIRTHLSGRVGYVGVRVAESVVAVLGIVLLISVVPVLFAPDTPSPVGVGIMLLLFLIGITILVASFIRTTVELFVYT